MSDENDFPKWVKADASHDINELMKLYEFFRDRTTGAVTFLVHSAEEEAAVVEAE